MKFEVKYYVAAAMQTIKYLLYEDDRKLKIGDRTHKGPLPNGYKLKLDLMDECDVGNVSWFQQLIGILRCAVELGSIDIQI